jgi:hypothetical protein
MGLNFSTGMATFANFALPRDCSICFWLRLKGNNTSVNRFFGTHDAFEIKYNVSGGKFNADLYKALGSNSFASLALNTQYHIACTTSKDTNTWKFLNATFQDNNGSTPDNPPSPASCGIGGRYGEFVGEAANGIMEDVRVYNRVLSAKEIQTIYTCKGSDGIFEGLVNRWIPFTKGTGADIGADPVYDIQGKQTASKYSNNITYEGGITSRRRCI